MPKLSPPKTNAAALSRICAWPLMVLALSLTACATTSPPVAVTCPPPPVMPSAREPQPSKPYSSSAQAAIQEWRKRLAATPLTP